MGYIMFDSAPALRSGRWLAAFFHSRRRSYGRGGAGGEGIVALLAPGKPADCQNEHGNSAKKGLGPWTSTQKRNLKMKLERGRRTPLAREDALQMLRALQYRISLGAGRRRLLPAEQRPQPIQTASQLASHPIHRFQGEGQMGFLCRRLGRASRQLLD